MLGCRRAICSRVAGQGPMRGGSDDGPGAATGIFGRRDRANRAAVPSVHIAMLTRLIRMEAKTPSARSGAMAVSGRGHLGRNRLTSDAPYKVGQGARLTTALSHGFARQLAARPNLAEPLQ